MANANVSIKLTPTEYRTLLNALEMYNDVLERMMEGENVRFERIVNEIDLMTHQHRAQELLAKVGPD